MTPSGRLRPAVCYRSGQKTFQLTPNEYRLKISTWPGVPKWGCRSQSSDAVLTEEDTSRTPTAPWLRAVQISSSARNQNGSQSSAKSLGECGARCRISVPGEEKRFCLCVRW